MDNRSPVNRPPRVRTWLLNRIGINERNPAGGLKSLGVLRQGMSLMKLRERPSLKESFGPVDGTEGKSLFEQHVVEAGLTAGDLSKRARAYTRNGILLAMAVMLALLACMGALVLERLLTSFSLAIILPVLLLLLFQNFLRARQIRERRYMGAFEYIRIAFLPSGRLH